MSTALTLLRPQTLPAPVRLARRADTRPTAMTRCRPEKVRVARRRLAQGHYDDPKVLEATVGRLLDELA